MNEVWVLVVGSLQEGVKYIIGPFQSEEQAEDYGEAHNFGHYPRFPLRVEAP